MNALYVRTFKNPQMLEEMLTLRKEGWSITALAVKYDCNFTSVWHQCKKYNIAPIKVTIKLNKLSRVPTYEDFNGEVVSKGKTYREYLREEEERKRARFAAFLRERRAMQTQVQ